MNTRPLPRIYSGWGVLAGSFICSALVMGFSVYIFGMFVVPVTEEFGISRANFNNGMIAFMIGTAVVAPLVGQMLDRFSARRVILVGGLCFGIAMMLVSRLDNLWLMLALLGGPLTFGASACGTLACNTVVVRWFRARRGRALGIAALSTSVGGFLSQPLTAFLIEGLGWRNALFTIGLAATVGVLLMAIFVIRDRPAGTEPGHDLEFSSNQTADGGEPAKEERSWGGRELIRSRNFWLVALGIGTLFAVDQAVLVSQVAYFQDIGYELRVVAVLVSVKTISAIAGKILVGYLADKVDLRLVFLYVAGSNATLLTIYILQPSFWFLLASTALFGVAVGGVLPVWSTILAWLFGSRSYGTVMGLMAIIMQPFAIVALRFIGEVHDRTGTYVPAFAVFIGLVIGAMLLISRVRPDTGAPPPRESAPELDASAIAREARA